MSYLIFSTGKVFETNFIPWSPTLFHSLLNLLDPSKQLFLFARKSNCKGLRCNLYQTKPQRSRVCTGRNPTNPYNPKKPQILPIPPHTQLTPTTTPRQTPPHTYHPRLPGRNYITKTRFKASIYQLCDLWCGEVNKVVGVVGVVGW